MDFFDRPVEDGFDRMFDMDHDGNLDPIEQGFQMEFIEKDGDFDENDEEDDFDDDDDWDSDDEMDELDEALEYIGYTREDLEYMDDEERAEVLEEAGLDPDDWD